MFVCHQQWVRGGTQSLFQLVIIEEASLFVSFSSQVTTVHSNPSYAANDLSFWEYADLLCRN